MKKYEWMRNDTASIMFAAVDSRKTSRLFRLSVVFKNEEIDPERLKEAVRLVVTRYQLYQYRNAKGFFWTYLEKANGLPPVLPEEYRPAQLRRLGNDGEPEMVFLYYKRRLSFETSHIMGDGAGTVELLKSVAAQYMILGGADKNAFEGIRLADTPLSETELENAYDRYKTDEKLPKQKRPLAYRLPYKYDKNYQNHISGLVKTADIKPICKEKGISITEFLAAAIILTMIKTAQKPINNTIILDVPVNLRAMFPTDTVRNFASTVPVEFHPQGKLDYTFDDIVNAIKGQLAKNNTKEIQQGFINSNAALTEKKILQVVPYFIKKPVLSIMQKKSHTEEMTLILSNTGYTKLPDIMNEAIERIEVVSGDARVYDLPMFFYITAMNEHMNLVFGLSGKDRTLCREFFRLLSSMGIFVRVESSLENGIEENTEIGPKICNKCNIRIGEEYSRCPLCDNVATKTDIPDEYFKTALYPPVFKEVEHRKTRKKNFILSKERLKAYFMLKP